MALQRYRNPFDAAYYDKHFAEFETDGFQEWSKPAGYIVFLDLSLVEIAYCLCTFIVVMGTFLISGVVGMVIFVIMMILFALHRWLKLRKHRNYLSVFCWKYTWIPPFNDFAPFAPVRAGLLRCRYPLIVFEETLVPGWWK